MTENTKKSAICTGGTANWSSPCSRNALVKAHPQKMPRPNPTTQPMTAMMIDSPRTIRRTCVRDMPTILSRPSSRVRSYTDRSSVLMMPSTAMISDRTSNATRPATNWSTVPSCMFWNSARESNWTFGKSRPTALSS